MLKKLFILTLISVLILGNTSVYADSGFTDLDNNHWAYNYIQKLVGLGLMEGYDDNTFRPDEVIDTMDALIYITRLFDITKDEVKELKNTYAPLLDKYSLEDKEKDALAIALDKGLVSQIFVENTLFEGKEVKSVDKTEISRYIAIAMGMKKEYKPKNILEFKDLDKISDDEKPYIQFLIDNEVLDKGGDKLGNFNPDQDVTRAVLAKMMAQAYDYIEETENTAPEIVYEVVKKYKGYIRTIYISDKPVLTLEGEDGNIDSYLVSNEGVMTLGDDQIDIYDLRLNFYVNLEIKDDQITKLDVESFR